MQLAKENFCISNNLSFFAKVDRKQLLDSDDAGIPAGHIGVSFSKNYLQERLDFLSDARQMVSRGPVFTEVESLQHKETIVLVPDKYFMFDGKFCRNDEMVIRIPDSDRKLVLPGRVNTYLIDTDKAMDSHMLGLIRSSQDVYFTMELLRKKQFNFNLSCKDRAFEGTDQFVNYVQSHGVKHFENCTFDDVDFRLAEIRIAKLCDRIYAEKDARFKFDSIDFNQCSFDRCDTEGLFKLNIDRSKNQVHGHLANQEQDMKVELDFSSVMNKKQNQLSYGRV